jgi:pilus assembly protein CpaB
MVDIMQGDVVTSKKIMSDGRMAGFTGIIPKDMRAVSIAIDDVTGVSGFARPGDRVDVIASFKNKDDSELRGEVVLQNVLLLGINKTADTAVKKDGDTASQDKDKKDSKDNKSAGTSVNASKEQSATATLAVSLDDAVKLTTLAQKGKIYLVLRSFSDADISLSVGFSLHGWDLFSSMGDTSVQQTRPEAAPVTAAAPQIAAPAAHYEDSRPAPTTSHPAPAVSFGTVEVLRGTESTNVEVR